MPKIPINMLAASLGGNVNEHTAMRVVQNDDF